MVLQIFSFSPRLREDKGGVRFAACSAERIISPIRYQVHSLDSLAIPPRPTDDVDGLAS